MKKSYLFLGILAFIILIAVITNPSQQSHQADVKSKINSLMQTTLKEDNSNDLGSGLGMLFGGVLIDKFVESYVTSNSYLIFSTTEVTWNGETKTIGFGLFGNVFLNKKIDETFVNAIKDKASLSEEDDKSSSEKQIEELQEQYTSVDSSRNTIQAEYYESLAIEDSLTGSNVQLTGQFTQQKADLDKTKNDLKNMLADKNAKISDLHALVTKYKGQVNDLFLQIKLLKK
jgi:hypothetical protein